jgi:hypothetical protein
MTNQSVDTKILQAARELRDGERRRRITGRTRRLTSMYNCIVQRVDNIADKSFVFARQSLDLAGRAA